MRGRKQQKTRFGIGQSTAEYAVLLALVVTALVGMQVYMKRGIQGRIRDLADQISPMACQYEKGTTNSFSSTIQAGNVQSVYTGGKTTTVTNETIARVGSEATKIEEQ